MKRKIFLFLFLLPLAVLAQPSPGSDTVWKKEIFPDYARSAFFSKDDSKLYVNTDRAVLIYEPLSGSLIREVKGKGFFLFETPDGRFIFTDSLLKLDAVTYEVVGMLAPRGDNYILTDLSMSTDGSVILASFWKDFLGDSVWKQQENNIVFYNPQNMIPFDQMTIKENVWKSEISPDKKYFSLSTVIPVNKKPYGKVVLFDYNTKQPIDTLLQLSETDITDIGWSPDSKYLAVLTPADVFIYKFPEQERYTEFPRYPNDYIDVVSFAFDISSKYILTGGGSDDETYKPRVWDIESKQMIYQYEHYNFSIPKFCSFSNNNKYLITGVQNRLLLYNTNAFITDVVEFEQHISGTIYPNPVNNKVILSFNVPTPEMYDIKLYNLEGLFIQQIFIGQLLQGLNSIDINCNSLPIGVYYISINNNEFYKLIKEN